MLESIVEFEKQVKMKKELEEAMVERTRRLNLIISFTAGFAIGLFGSAVIATIVTITSLL